MLYPAESVQKKAEHAVTNEVPRAANLLLVVLTENSVFLA
jgi:hypothetical protein